MKSLFAFGSAALVVGIGIVAGGCFEETVPVGSDDAGHDDAASHGDGGTTTPGECTSNDQCAAGEACAYAAADACKATGVCVVQAGVVCEAYSAGCACDGTEINVACTGLPAGYETKPLANAGECATTTPADGGTCVTVELSRFDTSCTRDSDCEDVTTGKLCDGACACGGSAINVSSDSAYSAAISGLDLGACPCPEEFAHCVSGTCAVGGPGPAIDAGAEDGGGACVTIDVSSYDVSCTTASDCTSITAGTLCDGDCACGGAAINTTSEAAYQQAISGLVLGECACPAEFTPECVGGVCVEPNGVTQVDGGPTHP